MSVQDRLGHGLQAHTMPHDLVPASNLSTQPSGRLVWHPNLGQEIARIEFGKNRRIDHVSLYLCARDQMDLAWVRNDDTAHVWRDYFRDRGGVARRLDDDMIVMGKPARECFKVISRHANPAQPDDLPLVEHHRFR